MAVLIKNTLILDPNSPFYNERVDVVVQDGCIKDIKPEISDGGRAKIIEGNHLISTIGLCDIGTQHGQPGFENRETIRTLSVAAMKGGFTHICPFPTTQPIIQEGAQIQWLVKEFEKHGITCLPMAALSHNMAGNNINEYYDLHHHGAVAFSDGLNNITNAAVLGRALQYSSTLKTPIIHTPNESTLTMGGQMAEGSISTSLGLKGVPQLAEYIGLCRDIAIADYFNGYLVIYGLSTQHSVAYLQLQKKQKKKISATVPYINLVCTDDMLSDFNVHFKVWPPLQSTANQEALWNGVVDNTIDAIVSNHTPWDTEHKDLEFPYAEFGAIGLQTLVPTLLDKVKSNMHLVEIVLKKLTEGPRIILNQDVPTIDVGKKVDMTTIDLECSPYTFDKLRNASLSDNSPFLGKEFYTSVVCTLNGHARYCV